jgi:putative ABC transport system permease protein
VGVRLAFRTLRRSPWYAATVVGTIALSISLASTVFAVVDGVLFKPLPYAAPERLFHIQGSAGGGEGTASLAPADVRYLNEADSRVRMTGYGGAAGLTHPNRPDLTIWSATIDERFFDVLGQRPLVGGFSSEHYRQPAPVGAARPAIVSHGFWQQWLGGEASAVGRTVDMVGSRLTILGVLPRDFVFPIAFGRVRPDVLLPRTPSPSTSQDRWSRSLDAVARLDDGISLEEARLRLSAALAARVNEYPPRQVRPGPYIAVSMRPLEVYLGANERPLFRLAFAGAALLVILGAVNVAGLFAARGRDRERELTLRVALGAGRAELGKLMMIEALLVALIGSIIGLLLAQPLLTIALTLLPESLLLMKSPQIDWRVVLFAIVTAIVVVSAFALAPAVAVVRSALSQRLSGGSTSTPRVRSWSRGALLAFESAIGICLVVAGSLTLASFIVLRGEDAGFEPEGLAVLEVRTPNAATPAEVQATHARVFDRLRSAPRVAALATVGVPLLENMFGGSQFAFPEGANRFFANDIPVAGSFFEVTGLRVLDGRVLTDIEIDAGRPFAVVSEATAREYWPQGRAVGQTLTSKERSVTVVGVVEEARFGAQDETRMGEIYLPASLSRSTWRVYLVKTAGDPEVVVREAALVIQTDVPGVLVRRAESFDAALLKSVRVHRFRTVLFGASATAGLLLLAVGIAGLVATGVARRVREIGIRSALGAQRGQLVKMVILDHLRPALAGVAFGLLASWWATRLLSAYLYEIHAHEPAVWFVAALGLLIVAVVAAWIPARRASAVDAMAVLKAE